MGNSAKNNKPGFAILIVVIAVAIIVVMMGMQTSALFNIDPGRKPASPEDPPWKEEHRLVGEDAFVEMPEPPKPVIDKPMFIMAYVTRNDADRGKVVIDILSNGVVNCKSGANYTQENRTYTFDAQSKGNVDVSKTWTDGEKKDKSLLYIYTKGKYQRSTYNSVSEKTNTESGIVYITGYISPDYSASGIITITAEDHEWFAQYDWQTK